MTMLIPIVAMVFSYRPLDIVGKRASLLIFVKLNFVRNRE